MLFGFFADGFGTLATFKMQPDLFGGNPPSDVLARWAILTGPGTSVSYHSDIYPWLLAFGILCTVVLAIRFWNRVVLQKNVDTADWIILCAWVCLTFRSEATLL